MNEECDAHELNLFLQDKLISLVPKNLRLKLKQFVPAEADVIRLTDSVIFENEESLVAQQTLNSEDR